jgi:mRNA interferase HigB
MMRIIALSTLKAFLKRNPAYADAADPLMAWYRQVKEADWATPADVKSAIRSASILQDGRVVFNIAGNKYRIVVWINYSSARIGNTTRSTRGTYEQERRGAEEKDRDGDRQWMSNPSNRSATTAASCARSRA